MRRPGVRGGVGGDVDTHGGDPDVAAAEAEEEGERLESGRGEARVVDCRSSRIERAWGVDNGLAFAGALEGAVEALREDGVGVEVADTELHSAARTGLDGGVEGRLEVGGVVAAAG